MFSDPRQRSIFDICANNHGGNENSTEARRNTNADVDRKRILAFIQAQGSEGATCDEIEQALSLPHQTASARCTDLKVRRLVRENGKRLTRRGSSASVLVAISQKAPSKFAVGDWENE